MIRALTLAIALLIASPQAHAQKAVSGEWISLGDVAPVTGDAAAILIGPAPPPGQTLALDPVFLVSVAKKSGVILAIPLDQPILVTRSGGNAPSAKAANTARPATPALQIAPPTAAPAEILVLVRDVTRGERLAEADLGWAPKPGTLRSGFDDMSVAIGLEARRNLKSGQNLQASDVKQPALVRKGEPVKLVYVSPGMRLTVEGLAQGDAGKGEAVRVLNSYSKRTVEAIAEADGEARVMKR